MFGPHYMEGRTPSIDNPPTVKLPEDDGHGLDLLYRLLHHQDCPRPTVPNSSQLAALLVLADKYDCVKAIRGSVCHHLHVLADCLEADCSTEDDLQSYLDSMVCSYIIQNMKLFRVLSCHLLQSSPRYVSFISAMLKPGAQLVSSFRGVNGISRIPKRNDAY